MQNEGLRRRSWRQRPAWRRRWPGGPGGVQPGRGGMEGQVAAPHPKGLEAANLEGMETAEVLEATAGLEAEANLEVLEAVGLEAAAAAILEVDYLEVLEADCGDRPGGGVHMAAVGLEAVANLEKPGGNGGPGGPRGGHPGEPRGAGGSHPGGAGGSHPGGAGGSHPGGAGGSHPGGDGGPRGGGSSSKEMRRRCGGPGGWPGGGPGGDGPGGGGPGGWPGGGPGGDGPGGGGRLGDPAVEVRRRLVIRPTSSSSMEGLKESLGMKITAQGLTTPPPPPPPPPPSSFRRSVLMVQAVKPPPL
ncbi:collagen alpha-1(I) chain [Gadus morhua]|uniref:collagen alpha-1(I) chain n=1 Tax=Gadus morhua TaxID=8049 RepID=UPI0011B70038|nr:collagen alpha-1(I) chain-like [Gadus morhua]